VNQGRKATGLYKLRWLSYITTGIILKKQTIGALALLISLSISAPTFAASTDFTDNDDYTTDAISGLDWLDLSLTRTVSYNDVTILLSDSSSDLFGWRRATATEFTSLHQNYTGNAGVASGPYVEQEDYSAGALVGLIAMLGDVEALTHAANDTTTNDYHDWTGSNMWSSGYLDTDPFANPITGNIENWDNTELYRSYIYTMNLDASRGYDSKGSFLVRNTGALIATPLPAALFMFAPALLGFIGLRRKLKA